MPNRDHFYQYTPLMMLGVVLIVISSLIEFFIVQTSSDPVSGFIESLRRGFWWTSVPVPLLAGCAYLASSIWVHRQSPSRQVESWYFCGCFALSALLYYLMGDLGIFAIVLGGIALVFHLNVRIKGIPR